MVALAPVESVTATVTKAVIPTEGVPLMVPLVDIVSGGGNPFAVNLYGGTPPDAATVAE